MEAQGRHRDRHGPARRRHPRARQLAARERQRRPATPPTTRARTARSAPPTSRARRSRRSRSPARWRTKEVTPDTDVQPRRRRSWSPTARSASRTRAATSRSTRARSSSSPPTSARSRSASGSAPRASTSGCAASASASRPASTCPGEEQGIVLPLERYSGSSMGNLPIGQGIAVTPMQMATAYSAIANGGDPAPGAHRRVGRRPRGAQAQGPPRDLRGDRGVAAADARGRARPGRHRLRRGDPRLRAGRQDRHGGEARPGHGRLLARASTSPRSSASRPPQHPKLLVAVMVDEPQGEIYGGLVAGPAFREITSFALNYLRIPPEVRLAEAVWPAAPGRRPTRSPTSRPVRGRRPARGRRGAAGGARARGRRLGASTACATAGRGRLGRGAGARPPRRAQRAAAAHPRPLRPPHRPGRARPELALAAARRASSARSTRSRGATRGRARTSPARRSSCCGRRPTPA